ncbi:MAG: bifunctional phosphopantothenoylcysteine decarboxylase/phosphopantothenate--cysteine ligase CoaBC [Candidatus Eisenbacteria bacterium]
MRVLIGVTASIAAYKAAEVVSDLKKSGAEVSVIMTEHATSLIGAATFRGLTGNAVRTDLFEGGTKRPLHIDLARDHDVVAIVPATANIIGKIACGICDDLLSTVVLSTTAPVVIAPAMNEMMYLNQVVQENVATLTARGYRFVEPETGWLACGAEGVGRLASLEAIVTAITEAGSRDRDLEGKKVIVTGGPTVEPIDAVRFISNRSSGKMAASLARVAARRGAETVLVTGPSGTARPAGVRVIEVETASDMKEAIAPEWETADCIVMAAAVCDFRPAKVKDGKIKREGNLTLDLVPTEDILAGLSAGKGDRLVVGFALETNNEIENAKRKLKEKNLDLIIANNPLREGAGFGSDTNCGHLIYPDGRVEEIPLMSKLDLSEKIFDAVSARLSSVA